MISFDYPGSIQIINDSIEASKRILADDNFYLLIDQKKKFDYSNCDASQVGETIKSSSLVLTVKTYKHPWGLSLGKEFSSDPTSVYINVAHEKLVGRTIPSIVNTLIHELVHAADSDNDSFVFNHGNDNSPKGKGDSAPYWIGCLAEMLLEKQGTVITVNSVDEQSQNDCG